MASIFSLLSNNSFSSFPQAAADASSNKSILIASTLSLTQQGNKKIQAFLTQTDFFIQNNQMQILRIEIDFQTKFQIILQNKPKSKKLGFRLSKTSSQVPISLFSDKEEDIKNWVSVLRQKINQLGFHQQFKAIRRLGKGQFATVFQVQNLQTAQKFAVKAFSKSNLNKTPKAMESLLNEIKIMRKLSHKNLQKLQSVFESQNSIYVVTELLRGGNVFERLAQLFKQDQQTKNQNVRGFILGLLNGLSQLNDLRIVHRDLKLDNIMLRDMNSFEPVIIDFGLGVFSDDNDYLYFRCGTPGYVSPQVMNCGKNQKVQPISDLFSVGAILHHLLIQKPLFQGKTSDQVLQKNKNFIFDFKLPLYQNVDRVAFDLLEKLVQLNPQKRIHVNEAQIHEFFSQNYNRKVYSPVSTTACQTDREIQNFLGV